MGGEERVRVDAAVCLEGSGCGGVDGSGTKDCRHADVQCPERLHAVRQRAWRVAGDRESHIHF